MLKTEVYTVSTNNEYDHVIFLRTNNGIYSFSPAMGMLERDDMTFEKLKDHMIQMENDGYSITKQIVSGGIEK